MSESETPKVVEANLTQFLSGMSAQTLMHLGRMQNPMTGQMHIDLPNAKYSIDLLLILQEKMQGNMTEEEAAYLKAALRELKVAYAQVTAEVNVDTTEN